MIIFDYKEITREELAVVKDIVMKMSLEEKALLMSGKTVWETFDIQNKGIPSIFLADGPHGLRKQEGASDHLGQNPSVPATCFPTAATLANSWDITLMEQVGKCIGDEAKNSDVQVVLGPGLNIKKNPRCGRNFEYFSEDPYLSGKMAAGLIRGIQQNGTAACPKHFAGNNQENLRMVTDSIIDPQTLREIYLTGFEIAVKEGNPLSLMTAYNKVNGEYANENEFLLRDVLINEWNFQGFLVSDWGGDNDHVKAVKNGAHLQMPSSGLNGPIEIVKAVEQGELQEAILNQRVEEILKTTLLLKKNSSKKKVDFDKHHKIAKDAAKRSVVLLKNEKKVLPIRPKAKVGIIGDFSFSPRYQGAGSSLVNTKNLETTENVVDNFDLNIIGLEKGFERTGEKNQDLLDSAISLAQECEVVLLYIGLDELSETEGKDRITISLAGNQLELINELSKTEAKVVAIVSAGSVIDMSWDNKVDAILHGYLSGEAGASAMLEIVSGEYSPSGKLNETHPYTLDDIPFNNQYPEENEVILYKEGIFVGYRYFDKAKKRVKYPFGFGLSYSEFEYSDLKVTDNGASFILKNVGECLAEEVAQLYIGNPSEKILHAVKDLKGFKKILLNPNEEKRVTIDFDDKSFRFFNTLTNKWEVETQKYDIMIASNSRDIRLIGKAAIEGDQIELPYDINQLDSYSNGEIASVTTEEFEILYGRKVPTADMSINHDLHLNSTIKDMQYARSPIARFVLRRINGMLKKSEAKGKPDLNLLFITFMPFRGIAKMTNGMLSMEMMQGLLVMINGSHIKGISHFISAFFRGRSEKRKFKEKLGWGK